MATQPTHLLGRHAAIIGGSMAGFLTARVLSQYFAQVTVLERDKVNDAPEARKGQPQTRHLHGLLTKGLEIMTHYFPDLPTALRAGGAILGDMGDTMRWHVAGGYRLQVKTGMEAALMSRPFLEWQVRRRVLALPNVRLLDEVEVERLVATDDRSRITGLDIVHRNDGRRLERLDAGLVVDASGRGSAAPKWLAALGYVRPEESLVKVNVGYATRVYRRRPGDLDGADLIIIAPDPPHHKRTGLIFPVEGDRWIVTLAGWAGDHPPTSEEGFLDFARSLPAPDLYNVLRRLEPLSDIVTHKFPGSLRRHYEKLVHFPEGYLVLGDAICSFNPAYGQGMTSAAMQAHTLDQLLAQRGSLQGIAPPFFCRAAKIVDIPWQLAVGEDFRFPETEGKKAPGTDFINAYITRVHRATHHDPVVLGEFFKVMNLMQPPTSLFHPKIVWRVLRRKRPAVANAPALQKAFSTVVLSTPSHPSAFGKPDPHNG